MAAEDNLAHLRELAHGPLTMEMLERAHKDGLLDQNSVTAILLVRASVRDAVEMYRLKLSYLVEWSLDEFTFSPENSRLLADVDWRAEITHVPLLRLASELDLDCEGCKSLLRQGLALHAALFLDYINEQMWGNRSSIYRYAGTSITASGRIARSDGPYSWRHPLLRLYESRASVPLVKLYMDAKVEDRHSKSEDEETMREYGHVFFCAADCDEKLNLEELFLAGRERSRSCFHYNPWRAQIEELTVQKVVPSFKNLMAAYVEWREDELLSGQEP